MYHVYNLERFFTFYSLLRKQEFFFKNFWTLSLQFKNVLSEERDNAIIEDDAIVEDLHDPH